jgi:hypothetical protein
MQTMNLTVKIAHQNRSIFEGKFAKLVRRAEKLGLTAPVAQWGASEWTTSETGGERTLWHNVTVIGQTIGFDGWKLVAAIDLLDAKSGAIIVRSQEESKPEWRENASRCDHCKAIRNRKTTVVVRHDNGTEMLVGTDCLRDFCPGTNRDPVALAAYFDSFLSIGSDMDDSDGEGFGGGGSLVIEPSRLLPVVAEIVLTTGFVSRSKAGIVGGEPTSETAMRQVYGKLLKGEDEVIPSQKAIEIAAASLVWVKSIEAANEYERNIQTLARANFGEYKHAGFIASIIPAYMRAMDMIKAKENRRAAAALSRHVGVVGEKLQTKVTLVRRIAIDSMYGTSHLHIFKDETGNTLKWFCSGSLPEFPAEGEFVEIVGTVKSHDMRDGQETGLTRVKLFVPKAKKVSKVA